MQLQLSHYLDLFRTYLKPQWPRVVVLAVLLFGSIALDLVNPQILGLFIDTVVAKGPLQMLILMALIFLGVAVCTQIVISGAAYFSQDVGWAATNAMREDLALHCLSLDLAFHKARTAGELMERVDGDVGALASFFAQFVIQVIGNGLLMIGVLLLVIRVNFWIGLALFLYAILSFFAIRKLQALAIPLYVQERQVTAELSGFYQETLSGLEDVASSGSGPYMMGRYFDLQRRTYKISLKSGLMGQAMRNLIGFLFSFSSALVLTLGAYFYTGRTMSMGQLITVYSYVTIFSNNLINLTFQFDIWQRATACMKRIAELYYTPSKIQDGPGVSFESGAASISFEDVSFGYLEDSPVLQNISFTLKPGETLGLIGRSGSGKTTLTRLLFRFYDPVQGTIRLDGHDLRLAKVEYLRSSIGVVTQDVQLFKASLRDNLTFFDHSLADDVLVQTIDDLGLGDWFRSLPLGLDSELFPNGTGLSAGEAQLLAFVRVFLKDPKLVILDEASSRLDMATEHLCMKAMGRLLSGRTGVIIAHRLATVERVDKIMVLEAGRIVEFGERSVLAADPTSRYSTLLKTMHPEELLA